MRLSRSWSQKTLPSVPAAQHLRMRRLRLRRRLLILAAACAVYLWTSSLLSSPKHGPGILSETTTLETALGWPLSKIKDKGAFLLGLSARKPAVASWPKYEEIGVIIRTGYQVQQRLEGPLSTWLKNQPAENVALLSDRASTVLGREVHDCIKPFLDADQSYVGTEPFDIYHKIQMMGLDQHEDQKDIKTDLKPGDHNEGWKLDIMKQTMSADLGYQMLRSNSKIKWWVLADDDTYMHLPSLSAELAEIDHNEMHYYGQTIPCGGRAQFYAHGGSGIVVSSKAMSALFEERSLCQSMHRNGATTGFGDINLANYFAEVDVVVEHRFRASFRGDELDYTHISADKLCTPLFSFHHLERDQMQDVHKQIAHFHHLRFYDVFKQRINFNDNSLWYRANYSYNLHKGDYLALPSDLATEDNEGKKEQHFNDDMPHVKLDPELPETARAGACKSICQLGAISKNCISWTYIAESRDCFLADWFRLSMDDPPRVGSVTGLLEDRLQSQEWRQKRCPPRKKSP